MKLQLVEASAASSRKRETSKPAEESEVPPEDQEVAVPSSAKRPKTSIKEEPASSSSSSEETDDEPELTQITITPWHRRMFMQASTRIKEEPREDGLGHILCHPTPNRKKPKDAHHFLGTTIELLKHPVDEDWNPSCLEMLGKGNWRVTYALDEGPPPGRPGFLVRGGATRLLGRDAFWQGGRNGGAHPGEGFPWLRIGSRLPVPTRGLPTASLCMSWLSSSAFG